ncbi:MAG TPA: PP2C family serine/threonine-protein phosphatase [Urbifossiella sp.]|nr:PP2C family serine/threonine-protein phosphatase [Urbifossiella sp.]
MTDPSSPPPPPDGEIRIEVTPADHVPDFDLQLDTDAPALAVPPPLPPQLPPPLPAQLPPPLPPPPAAVKRAEWKVLEPDERTDPVPHEAFEAGPAQPGWEVVAASVRGKLHAHKGQWREDSYKWATADGWTILAVSDGAGSARLSRVGSRLACDTAVSRLQKLLAGYAVAPAAGQPADADLQRVREFLRSAADQARLAVLHEARARSAPIKDFSATLLLAVVAPWADRHLVAVLQAGDGAVGVMATDGVKRLGVSDHGEYSSETRFLTTPGMELEYSNRVVFSLPAGLRAVALMSDGVSDDFYPEDKRLGELFTAGAIDGLAARDGGPLPGLPAVAADPRGGAALCDWLRYEKRGSSDDRTLVLLHRSAP